MLQCCQATRLRYSDHNSQCIRNASHLTPHASCALKCARSPAFPLAAPHDWSAANGTAVSMHCRALASSGALCTASKKFCKTPHALPMVVRRRSRAPHLILFGDAASVVWRGMTLATARHRSELAWRFERSPRWFLGRGTPSFYLSARSDGRGHQPCPLLLACVGRAPSKRAQLTARDAVLLGEARRPSHVPSGRF